MLARREVIRQFAAAPVAVGSLAAVLANPDAARAAASSLETVTIATASGREISAAWGAPSASPAPSVVLIHEWWGLNDQIKAVAADFVGRGYGALAIDLYGGNVATTPDEAKAYMQALTNEEAFETCGAWIDWLRAREDATGAVGTVGWCFGGGWSLNASLVRPVEATVIYYGNVERTAEELAPLAGPVQGHFGLKDARINQEMVSGFETAMEKAGKSFETYWYDADHAFANPSGGRYDAEDAALAWERTSAFLDAHLA